MAHDNPASGTISKELLHFLAHEFKTPLFLFRQFTTFMKEGKPISQEDYDQVLQECDRYEQLIHHYLSFNTDPISLSQIRDSQ